MPESLFKKVVGLRQALRTPFFIEHLRFLVLQTLNSIFSTIFYVFHKRKIKLTGLEIHKNVWSVEREKFLGNRDKRLNFKESLVKM